MTPTSGLSALLTGLLLAAAPAAARAEIAALKSALAKVEGELAALKKTETKKP